jgi:hypothetical protein
MRSGQKTKPREQWVLQPNSFLPIVAPEVYDAAQKKLRSRFRSGEQLLQCLRDYVEKNGRICFRDMRPHNGLPSHQSYRAHFGSFLNAYHLAGFKSDDGSAVQYCPTRARLLRTAIAAEFRVAMMKSELSFAVQRGRVYLVEGLKPFVFDVARCVQPTLSGEARWQLLCRMGLEKMPRAVARLHPDNGAVKDWCLVQEMPSRRTGFRLRDVHFKAEDSARATASDLITLLLQRLK